MAPQFPIIPSDRADDLHHLAYAESADLVLFMAGNQFMDMYRQAGGDELVHRIMQEKRDRGTTIYTVVHHRETPLRIAERTVDVGPVWATEAVHAASTGFAFDVVEPGEELDRREHVHYYICKLAGCPHQENAQRFIDFIRSTTAQRIYRQHGFVPAATA